MCFLVQIVTFPDEKSGDEEEDEGEGVSDGGGQLSYFLAAVVIDAQKLWEVGGGCAGDEEDDASDGSEHLKGNVGEDDVVLVLQSIAEEEDECLADD